MYYFVIHPPFLQSKCHRSLGSFQFCVCMCVALLNLNEVCGAAFAAPMDPASVIAEFILLNCQQSVEFENNDSGENVCAIKSSVNYITNYFIFVTSYSYQNTNQRILKYVNKAIETFG